MITWILDNKEWVFSGAGVAVIVAVAGWLYRRFAPHTENKSGTVSARSDDPPEPASKSHWERLVASKAREPSKNLRDYDIQFTPDCLSDLDRLNLTQDQVISLIQSEFRSHMNYFRFDLEDYMMPVKARYIVYMDKIGNSLTFKRILPCTQNEAKLSSWSDILATYRRATRLAYRNDPNVLFTGRGQFGASANLHLDIERRVVKHFEEYEKLCVEPFVVRCPEEAVLDLPLDVPRRDELQSLAVSVAFHLSEARNALDQGFDIVKDLDADIRSPDSAIGDLVASLERSLQHIHKILILFPPTDEPSARPTAPQADTPPEGKTKSANKTAGGDA